MEFFPDPLIFTHMHKSGGMTLQNTVVKRQYAGGVIHRLNGRQDDADAFRALPQEQRHRINLLTGHMYFGMHEYLRPGATYMTMLRDPVERVISFYYFVRRLKTHYMWRFGFTEETTLREFLEQRRCIELDNFQTRNLCRDPGGHLPFGKVKPHMCDEALDNLDRYSVIGVTEQFDDSLRILTHRFGWKDVSYKRLNVTPGRPRADEIEPGTVALIRELNHYDVLVYEKARAIFHRQLAEAEAALGPAGKATPSEPGASRASSGSCCGTPR